MVTMLEELIEKLWWEQQEEALALWLHHFASPETDAQERVQSIM